MSRFAGPSPERVRPGSDDVHVHEATQPVRRPVEMDDSEVARSTRQAPALDGVDEDLLARSDARGVQALLAALLVPVENLEASFLLGCRHGVAETQRRRARTRRVEEHEQAVEADALDEVDGG